MMDVKMRWRWLWVMWLICPLGGTMGAAWMTVNTPPDGAMAWAMATNRAEPFSSNPPPAAALLPAFAGRVRLAPQEWQFYTFQKSESLTNLAVALFQPMPLSDNNDPALYLEHDLDIYVSDNSELTNLAPDAVQSAIKSLSRNGTETVLLRDASAPVYYVGVKSESPTAAQFTLVVAASAEPFSQRQPDGSIIINAFSAPAVIPDGTTNQAAWSLAITDEPGRIHGVVVSTRILHDQPSDLRGWLYHGGVRAGLNDGTAPNQRDGSTNMFTWDDSGWVMPGSSHTSGPGALTDFSGGSLSGLWVLYQQDKVTGSSGVLLDFSLLIEPEAGTARAYNLPPGCWDSQIINVSPDATNLLISAALITGEGHVLARLCKSGAPQTECDERVLTSEETAAEFTLNKFSNPPLSRGQYTLSLMNDGPEGTDVAVQATQTLDDTIAQSLHIERAAAMPLPDAGVAVSTLVITNNVLISKLTAGVRIEHPRVSDLQLRLRSPDGASVALSSFRGQDSAEGFGMDTSFTNTLPVSSSGGASASTNIMTVGAGHGSVAIDYHFYSLPDALRVYRGTNLLFNTGLVSGSGRWFFTYAPDPSGSMSIVLNEGDNFDTNTAWDYAVTTTRPGILPALFTEDTNLTVTPIKFAAPPFTNVSPVFSSSAGSNLIAYLPEESMDVFSGLLAKGEWRLEILDRRAGPAPGPIAPRLIEWELNIAAEDLLPLPLPMSHGASATNLLRASQWAFYAVDVPSWTQYVTNELTFSSAPVSLWFANFAPPLGTNAGDTLLLQNTTSGVVVLNRAGPMPIRPGQRLYIGVQNTNWYAVNSTLRITFDVPKLFPATSQRVVLNPDTNARYFEINPAANSRVLSIGLTNVAGNPELVLRRGLPLPDIASFDYSSMNPAAESESLVVTANSDPLPLGPGRWFLGIINATPELEASGDLTVTEAQGGVVITRVEYMGTFVRVVWSSEVGSSFQVEWSPAISPPQWTTFPVIILSENGYFVFEDMDPSDTARFYRVVEVR